MTKEERQVSEFIARFHRVCLEEQDVEETGRMISEDVIWIGTGKYGLVKGRETVLKGFREMKSLEECDYRILNEEYEVTYLTDTIYSFVGSCYVRRSRDQRAVSENEVRLTGICRLEGGEGSIVRIHHSLPLSDWLEHPEGQKAENERVLRSLVGLQSKELAEKNMNLDALIQNIPGGVICCKYDEDLELLFYSDGFLNMFGYTRDDMETLFENKFSRMIIPEDLQLTWGDVVRQLKDGNTKEIEYRVVCKDGRSLVIQDRGQLVMREGIPVFYCILIDITERRKADEELKLSLERYQIVLNQATDIIFEWDIASDTLTCSPNWVKKFGYEPLHERISQTVPESVKLHNDDKKIFRQMQKELLMGAPFGEHEIRIACRDGRYLWCRIRYTLQKDQENRPVRAIGLIADIDREKREKERLLALAEQDSLTGLYNRGAIQTLIQRYVVKATPLDGCALLMLDVDNFKKINDIYGHLSGDEMLKDISELLRRQFERDALVGRVRGDEFAVLLLHVSSRSEVEASAAELLQEFRTILQQQNDIISCSIGISMAPEDGDNFAAIYKNADTALYHAKRQGRNRCAFYGDTLKSPIEADMQAPSAAAVVLEQNIKDQNLTGYVMDILSRSHSMEKSINQLLEIVGRQVNVSRVYIFEDSEDGRTASNTFEWCKEGIRPEKENLQNVDLEALDHYYNNFNEEGIFFCRDVTTLLSHQRLLLENQGIKSVLQCLIMDQGRSKGFIGFDECEENRYWTGDQIRLLQIISRILGIFLIKGRTQEQLEKAMAGFSTALEEQRDWFCVLDPDSCHFLYTSERVREMEPEAHEGAVCHQVFFQTDRRCEGCPIALMGHGRNSASSLVWNRNLNHYVHTRAQAVLWPGGREACMVSCKVVEGLERQQEIDQEIRQEGTEAL